MSRLIVVSNRVSVAKGRGAAGAQGGLAVAMSAALHKRGGIWFGWSGNEVEHFTGQLTMERADGFTTATVDLEPQDVDEYYNGYANRTLWPLFHYRIDLAEYENEFGRGYERVNEQFANSLGDRDLALGRHFRAHFSLGNTLNHEGITERSLNQDVGERPRP